MAQWTKEQANSVLEAIVANLPPGQGPMQMALITGPLTCDPMRPPPPINPVEEAIRDLPAPQLRRLLDAARDGRVITSQDGTGGGWSIQVRPPGWDMSRATESAMSAELVDLLTGSFVDPWDLDAPPPVQEVAPEPPALPCRLHLRMRCRTCWSIQ